MNDLIIKFILSAGTLFIMFNIAGLLTWVERKQSALMQDRIGANRASIFGFKAMGLFHAIADFLKMLSKEEFMPEGANKFLFNLAPYLSIVFALVGFAAIPIGGALVLHGHVIRASGGQSQHRAYLYFCHDVHGGIRRSFGGVLFE